jgi:hypothetical protein
VSHRDAPEPDEPPASAAYCPPGQWLVRDLLMHLAPVVLADHLRDVNHGGKWDPEALGMMTVDAAKAIAEAYRYACIPGG